MICYCKIQRFVGFRKGLILQLSITDNPFLFHLLAGPSSMFGDSCESCNTPSKLSECSLDQLSFRLWPLNPSYMDTNRSSHFCLNGFNLSVPSRAHRH